MEAAVQASNPTMESMQWDASDLADAIFARCESHFLEENPSLETPGEEAGYPGHEPGAASGHGPNNEATTTTTTTDGDGASPRLAYMDPEGLIASTKPQLREAIAALEESKPHW